MFDHVFQFLPATSKFNEQMWFDSRSNIVVVDLEDSLQNVIKPEQNSSLKKEGREKLLSYFNQPSLKQSLLSIRINNSGSDEFKKDLLLLALLKNIKLDCIFLPKVESKEGLENYADAFSELNIKYNFLVPIIETKHGLSQLWHILQASCKSKLHYFAWGHHDYNLDAGHWPFIEQDNKEYWDIARKFIQEVETAGYHYLCGAFTQIYNDELFLAVAAYEKNLCSKSAAHVALNHRQAKLLHNPLVKVRDNNFLSGFLYDNDKKILLAEETISLFQNSRQTAFRINETSNAFISPQQYLAARNFLHTIKS